MVEQEIEMETPMELSLVYPPKVTNGQFVAIARSTKIGYARVNDDLDEGEDRIIDVDVIRTKKNELMVGWKTKKFECESKYILDVIEVDESNNILNIDLLERHYKAYHDKYFVSEE